MKFRKAGTANGANVYRSECGRYRLTSAMVTRRIAGSYRATTYRAWSAIDLQTSATVAEATSLQKVKARLALVAAS
jgi:hypothetical protein